MSTQSRQLGRSPLHIDGPLAFGGNVFGWTADEATSFRLLDTFVHAGLNFIDTADVYSRWVPGHVGGESESILGRWLKTTGKGDKVVIATKCGMDMGGEENGLSAPHIRRAVDRSLQRLGVEHIDLYQSHRDDPTVPQAETLGAFGELVRAGKVRAIGASNFSAARLGEALRISAEQGLPRYESLQPEYNLMDRTGYEAELEPLCRREGVGVITYFSLAAGLLSGKYATKADAEGKARGKKVGPYFDDPRGPAVLAAVRAVAAEHRSTPARVALAWVIARPGVTAPIASATTLSQLYDLIAATELELTAHDIAALNDASS
jgi:aryl-alcohol dehydrogenase-like predicted oxidoreductase